MSKEELLKYLIAEIDLIMHDKDYRFENANGTWYSRESCRDLTNEEVFEELRTELRQFADLEAKLAESNESHHKNIVELTKMVTEKDRKIEELKQQLATAEKALELACEPRDDWGGEKYSGTEYDNYYDYFMAEAKEMLENE